jgi:tRNA modification GTPase
VQDDTIVAIATPAGRGALGVVRLSGPFARTIAEGLLDRAAPLAPRHATFARLVVTGSGAIDQVVATFFPAPASYTGENVVEISAHGSPLLLREIVAAALRGGARLANRGEFTLRAFLNGRLDLVQAEAVGDLIAATTSLQARAAFDQLEGTLTTRIAGLDARVLELVLRFEASLDFPDEGYRFVETEEALARIDAVQAQLDSLIRDGRRGRLIREGLTVAIVGRPNVGKSSVFNRLAGADRAIVHHTAGTTRDLVSEVVDLDGLAVTLVDTAGLRDSAEAVEAEGVKRAEQSARASDLVLAIFDSSEPLTEDDRALLARTAGRPRVCVLNKADLPSAWSAGGFAPVECAFGASAKEGTGFDLIRQAIRTAAGMEAQSERAGVTNMRHVVLLERAAEALARARWAAASRAYEELVLAELHETRAALEEVTGRRSADDLLNEIFDRFCIGK